MTSLFEASALEWSNAPAYKGDHSAEAFQLGMADLGALCRAVYSAVAGRKRVREEPPPQPEAPQQPCLDEASAPWLQPMVAQQGYKQVMDHSAWTLEAGGLFPEDHLFRAMATSGLVLDTRVLMKHSPPADGGAPGSGVLDVVTVCQLGSDVCGHAGVVHGGMTAALIDESYGFLLYLAKAEGLLTFEVVLTASLDVSYKLPLLPNHPVCVTTWVKSIEGRKIWVEAVVSDKPLQRATPDGAPVPAAGDKVFATSKALFLVPRSEGVSTAVLKQASQGRTDTINMSGATDTTTK